MILFIEDNKDIQLLYKIVFKKNNLDYILAENYKEAVSKMNNSISLVICDHNFPFDNQSSVVESGDKFYNYLRNDIKNNVNFIHFSSDPQESKYLIKENFYSIKKSDKKAKDNLLKLIRNI